MHNRISGYWNADRVPDERATNVPIQDWFSYLVEQEGLTWRDSDDPRAGSTRPGADPRLAGLITAGLLLLTMGIVIGLCAGCSHCLR